MTYCTSERIVADGVGLSRVGLVELWGKEKQRGAGLRERTE